MSIKKKEEDIIKDIDGFISDVDLEGIKSEGITIRSGNKLIKFTIDSESDISSIEDDVRKEMKIKITERLTNVREKVLEKLSEMSHYVSTVKNETEQKKREYEKKIANANIMPDITFHEHATQGLSVVKSEKNENDSYTWLFQAIYWPKYIDNKIINPSYSKRLMNHIILAIDTTGDKITYVRVLKPFTLERFPHYHDDCWGNWKPVRKWKTIDDIIKVAKEAEVVLETINTGSLAMEDPDGLMDVEILKKHSKRPEGKAEKFEASKRMENMGITEDFERENVWQV